MIFLEFLVLVLISIIIIFGSVSLMSRRAQRKQLEARAFDYLKNGTIHELMAFESVYGHQLSTKLQKKIQEKLDDYAINRLYK